MEASGEATEIDETDRATRLRALVRLGEMADQGDFDEFLGHTAAYRR